MEFVPSAARAFKKLPAPLRTRIASKVEALSDDPRPRGVEKLSGHDDRYRVRVGDYRVIYVIGDGARLVTVAVIGHRRDVYR